MTDSLKGLLVEVRRIAEEAGEAIRNVYEKGDLGTVYKEDRSPLTFADQAAHDVIVRELNRLTPDYPVLTEESKDVPYAKRSPWQYFWLVDPLDGTKEFIERNGQFTVNIALIDHGRPVLGVLHAPELLVTYYGAKDSGAYKEEKGRESRIHVSDYRDGPLKIVASRSHAGKKLKKFLEQVHPAEVIHIGSALKICLVAEGRAHFYPRLGPTMEWDTAAGHAILNEAGGSLITLDGEELRYNRKDMTNPYFMACGNPPFPWQKYRAFL